MTPIDFWRLHPKHFWWMVEAHVPPEKQPKGPTNDQLARKLERLLEDEARNASS